MRNNKKNSQNERVTFNAQFCGHFAPTKIDRRLHELAKQYHEETEAYDRLVCSGRNDRGIAIPTNALEHGLINRNALKVRKRLLYENQDIGQEELRRAITRYVD